MKTTNGLSQVRLETRNALGETLRVYDHACEDLQYSYDAVGNLTRLTGVDGALTSMTYDLAGRKTALSDPDKGSWQYAYNALGELTRQRDSKNQAIDFTYDALGRVTDRREKTGVTTITSTGGTIQNREATTFKTSGNGIGQPNVVTYRTGDTGTELHRRSYSHNAFGRVTGVTTTIGALTFTENSSYDQFSRPFQRFDASGGNRGERYHYLNGHLSKIQEAREGTLGVLYQEVLDTDAWGNVTAFELGNGVEAFAEYEPESGRLLNLEAYQGVTELQQLDYLYDVLGNLQSRHDQSGSLNLKETFAYDTLNRLAEVDLSVNGATAVTTLTLAYNVAGNITSKSDVGSYVYPAATAARPHAVTTAGGVTYTYDLNGNQTSGNGRTITYTLFDQAASITKGTKKTEFAYGIGNARYQRKDFTSNVLQKTTVYLDSVEYITEGASTYYKRYIGGVALADYYPSTGIQQTKYLLKDHLGSIHTVLNDTGQVVAREHFAAFGIRQDATNWQTPLNAAQWAVLNAITTRGFTGHEHADDVGIIHMNGRIYDPVLGRFLQADPFVQAPKNSQSLNRYSYVLNNPLSYTDPSGYSFSRLWKNVIRPLAAIAISIYLPGSAAIFGTYAGGLFAASATGFVAGLVATGSIRGALIGAFTGAAFHGIGTRFQKFAGEGNWGELGLSGGHFTEKTMLHGLVGGSQSLLSDGKFGHGFASAGFTQAMSGKVGKLDAGNTGMSFQRTISAAVLGGTASSLTGGKFANGAVTGAFSLAFNDALHGTDERQLSKNGRSLTSDEKVVFAKHIPADVLDSARIIDGQVPRWLRKDMAAITLGNKIYFRKGVYVPGSAGGVQILGHELVHVQQYAEGMSYTKYIWKSRRGYENNRYEVEAYTRDLQIQNSFCTSNPQAAGC